MKKIQWKIQKLELIKHKNLFQLKNYGSQYPSSESARKMNEYKIQLESREDFTFLKEEMMKFFNENYSEEYISEIAKQQVIIDIHILFLQNRLILLY